MPSTYAHRRFGADVLEHLPAPCRKSWKTGSCIDIGLHGPDLLFYYHAAKSTPVGALGNAMHEQPGRFSLSGPGAWCNRQRTGTPRWPMRWASCAILRWTAPATPAVEAYTRQKRGEPLRNRDRVRRHAAAPGRQ